MEKINDGIFQTENEYQIKIENGRIAEVKPNNIIDSFFWFIVFGILFIVALLAIILY